MLQLLVVAIGAWLTISYTAFNEREKASKIVIAKGDIAAANFLSYRQSVVTYRTKNPTTTGTIADGALIWQTGFIRDNRWGNVVSGGELYVYSTAPLNPTVLQSVYAKTGNTLMVGTKNVAGNLLTGAGSIIPVVLPSTIPVGAIVYIGA